MGFLIDTCIWVDIERGSISPADVELYTGKEAVYISPVTIAELTFGIEMAKKTSIKNKRISAINRLRKKPQIFITETTGFIFGKIASDLFKKGKAVKYRVQDIWLASQAIEHNYKFLTGNIKDFKDIQGLDLIEFVK